MEQQRKRPVTALDVTALLFNVVAASKNHEVGFEDASRTLKELLGELNVTLKLSESTIESALWCANLLDEREEYVHPLGVTFESFAQKLAGQEVFDRGYNYFRDRKR